MYLQINAWCTLYVVLSAMQHLSPLHSYYALLRFRRVKLLVTERKMREYTELDSVLRTELLISKGDLQSLLLYLILLHIVPRLLLQARRVKLLVTVRKVKSELLYRTYLCVRLSVCLSVSVCK